VVGEVSVKSWTFPVAFSDAVAAGEVATSATWTPAKVPVVVTSPAAGIGAVCQVPVGGATGAVKTTEAVGVGVVTTVVVPAVTWRQSTVSESGANTAPEATTWGAPAPESTQPGAGGVALEGQLSPVGAVVVLTSA